MEEIEFDFKDAEAVKDFMGESSKKIRSIANYALEYSGDIEGRKLRDNQVGKRENYTQGDKQVIAERLIINWQKKIVKGSVSFLVGDAPKITANDIDNENGIAILDTLKSNRFSNKIKKFAESVMSTTMAVFIFSKNDEGDVKMRNHGRNEGNYYPQYDVYGDLIAFYWEFAVVDKKHIWVFTPTEIHKYVDEKYINSDSHDFGIIPVVFLEQDRPEWWDVKELIDRHEMMLSKLAGSNNYFAFPILKLMGGVVKDDDGKDVSLIDITKDGKNLLLGYAIQNNQVIQADAEFVQRDANTDSIKLEVDLLKEYILNISQTADLSFDNVKGIGALSGKALLLMLQDSINKAKWKQGDYATVISRILKVTKAGLGIVDEELTFDIEFKYAIPEDIKEQIDMLYNATGGKATMSQETAIQHNPLVTNPSEEIDKIAAQQSLAGETFNL